ncbi:hypothetical protein KFE25_003033 [Diacronema lutheri]|uniref:O-acyltransferase WSD1 C-terminal domain-containing protein n=1 Tax=Diacronema lutheri TaxID=2081491 RepID=A0A8J6C8I2_DIALT|nr:hypothetical protein KFE25_003033 [Diacronema lutheri]
MGPASSLVSLALGVLLLPPTLVLLALRVAHDALVALLYGAPGSEPIDPKDSVWQPKPDAHRGVKTLIVACLEIDRCTLAELRDLVRIALVERRGPTGELAYPRFSQRAVRRGPLGAWFWEDVCALDVQQHVVAAPADARTTEGLVARMEALADGTAGVGTAFDSPLWRFELVEEPVGAPLDPLLPPLDQPAAARAGATARAGAATRTACGGTTPPASSASAARSVVLLQTHHAMADGAALVELLVRAFSPAGAEPKFAAGARARASVGPHGRLGVGGLSLRVALRAAIELPLLSLGRLVAPADRNAFRGRITTKKRMGRSRSVPLAAVRELAAAAGTSVNAVLLAAIALALRERLLERGAAVPRDVHAVAPVVTRPRGGRIRMENEFAIVFVPLPVGLGAEPRAALARAAERVAELKAGVVAHAMVLVLRLTHALLPECASVPLLALVSDKATLLFSTLPGPDAPIVWGAPGGEKRVHSVAYWAPVRSAVGMSVSSFTYRGRLGAFVLTDEGVERQPQAIADRFAPAVDALRAAHGLPPVTYV